MILYFNASTVYKPKDFLSVLGYNNMVKQDDAVHKRRMYISYSRITYTLELDRYYITEADAMKE